MYRSFFVASILYAIPHRVFSASLLQAQRLARETGRYIVYYCEEDIENALPSYFTYAFRRALTDPNVEELLNEQVTKAYQTYQMSIFL